MMEDLKICLKRFMKGKDTAYQYEQFAPHTILSTA